MENNYIDLDANVLKFQTASPAERDVIFDLIYADVKGLIYRRMPYHAVISGQQADWAQEACISLLEAIGRFNPEFRVKFITYFNYYLKQAKNNYDENGSRLVTPTRYSFGLIGPAIIKFPQAKLDDPDKNSTMPWDGAVDFSRDIKLLEMREDFKKASVKLRDYELKVLILMMEGKTQREVTKILEYGSHERVRQIYQDAIDVCMGRTRSSVIKGQSKKRRRKQT